MLDWRRVKVSDVVSVVSLVIALASLGITIYLSFFWRPEDLRVYFFTREMTQVGNTPVSVSLVFSNGGKQAAIVSDVVLIQATGPRDGFDVCAVPELPQYVETKLGFSNFATKMPLSDGTELEFAAPVVVRDETAPLTVSTGETKLTVLQFRPQEIDPLRYPVVHCLGIRYFDKNGDPHLKILPAWRVSLPWGGRAFTPATQRAYRLLPPV